LAFFYFNLGQNSLLTGPQISGMGASGWPNYTACQSGP